MANRWRPGIQVSRQIMRAARLLMRAARLPTLRLTPAQPQGTRCLAGPATACGLFGS